MASRHALDYFNPSSQVTMAMPGDAPGCPRHIDGHRWGASRPGGPPSTASPLSWMIRQRGSGRRPIRWPSRISRPALEQRVAARLSSGACRRCVGGEEGRCIQSDAPVSSVLFGSDANGEVLRCLKAESMTSLFFRVCTGWSRPCLGLYDPPLGAGATRQAESMSTPGRISHLKRP